MQRIVKYATGVYS